MGRVRLAGQSPSLDLRQRLAAAEERIGEQAMQIKSIFDFINHHGEVHKQNGQTVGLLATASGTDAGEIFALQERVRELESILSAEIGESALQKRVKFCDERIKQLELEIWELQNDD